MHRRTPTRHSVRGHTRSGAKVSSYMRGSGSKPRQRHRSPLTTTQRKALPASAFVFPKTRRYPIHDRARAINALARVSAVGSSSEKTKVRAEVHKRYPDLPTDWKERQGRKNYKPGESISYKDSRGKRVSGTVRAVRKEHYIVERKDRLYKVDRHSPFDQIGRALKRGAQLSKRLVVATPGALQKAARVAGAVAGAPERTERRLKRFRAELKREFETGKGKGLPNKGKGKHHYVLTLHPMKGKDRTFRRKFRTKETATKFIQGRVSKTTPGDIYSISKTYP